MYEIGSQHVRVQQVCKLFDLDYKELAKILSFKNKNSGNGILNGRKSLTNEKLVGLYFKLKELHPNKPINLHWLLTGEGEMILPPTMGKQNTKKKQEQELELIV